MNLTFEGKRVLVTGAGRGIGKDLALRLSNYKAYVFGLCKTKENLDELVNIDPNIHPICVDLCDWDATQKAIESILPIDLLVNNASICDSAMFVDATPENFDETLNVNTKAAFNVSQIVAKNMIERNSGGSIVNVSSLHGQVAFDEHIVYSVSKGALDMFSKSMALELGPHNIRVNSVALTATEKCGLDNPEKLELYRKKIPLGRFANIDEIVDSIIYLLSDRSSMITGVCLPIDGGFLAT